VRRTTFFAALLAVALLGIGCRKSTATPPEARRDAQAVRAQPRLPVIKLWLGAQELAAEIARSDDQIMTGMMFRTNIAESEGMLFVFPTPRRTSFWMHNVPIPLSCAYIDSGGTILEIHDLKPHEDTPIVADSDRIQFVLETSQGWFQRNQVSTGTLIRTERGPLLETFYRRGAAIR
jgi:uncharacterized protein